MAIVRHDDLVQGTADWHKARNGLLTASEMKFLLTPGKLQIASNDKERAHLYTIVAQRISGYTEDAFQGYAMLRGHEDEFDSRLKYHETYLPVEECGFITNDRWGFTLGFSPDGLVKCPEDGDGFIEAKSRAHKLQIETILTHAKANTMPDEFAIQVQTGMLVSERNWCDFISYSAGLPMWTVRIYEDAKIQKAILEAAEAFEEKVTSKIIEFASIIDSGARLLPTERRAEEEITI